MYHGIFVFLISLFIAALPLYHGTIGIPKSPFILVCQTITTLSHSPDHRLFRLASVSWHYWCYHITVYFGSAKESRHQYSSHIIKGLIIAAYDGLIIYHGSSAIPVSKVS